MGTDAVQSRRRPRLAAAICLAAFLALAWPARVLGEDPLAPAKGRFLVARPEMKDTNFAETVVLLLRYGSDGAMGLVVNRPSGRALSELLPDLEDVEASPDPIYFGGPVTGGELFLLVRSTESIEGARSVLEDVQVSQSRALLERLLDGTRPQPFRVYAGYAGWAPGQLDHELARGDWTVLAATSEQIFDDEPAGMWHRLTPRKNTDWALGTSPRFEASRRIQW